MVVHRPTSGVVDLYRAQVLYVDHINVGVWALDYGYEMTVPRDQVYSLPFEVHMDQYPPQIVLCCMKGENTVNPLLFGAFEFRNTFTSHYFAAFYIREGPVSIPILCVKCM